MERNKNKKKKYFIITIDTEGDDLWTYKCTKYGLKEIKVTNANGLERFQLLCEKYKFIPTWLVNYEMSQSEVFQELGKDAISQKKAEIGMHMHAWNNPPIRHLPFNPKGNHPYLGEYTKKEQWEKMRYLKETLEDTFHCPVTSFRNGRWYFDEFTLKCLKKLGIIVDCSMTPGISWANQIGNHMYGSDYSKDKYIGCYQLSNKDIHKVGNSGVYEMPPTILSKTEINSYKITRKKVWLRPNGYNLKEMLWVVDKINKSNIDYLEFMIHSSELYPRVNPIFNTQKSIEMLYEHIIVLFDKISQNYEGIGLSNYVNIIRNNKLIH